MLVKLFDPLLDVNKPEDSIVRAPQTAPLILITGSLDTTGIITVSTIISSTEIHGNSANNAVTTKLYVDTKIANNIGDGIDLDFITVKEYIDTKIQGLDIKDSVKFLVSLKDFKPEYCTT